MIVVQKFACMASDVSEDYQQTEDIIQDDGADLLNYINPYHTSKYICEDEFSEFFKFSDHTSINVLHVNCRSLKKKLWQPNKFI